MTFIRKLIFMALMAFAIPAAAQDDNSRGIGKPHFDESALQRIMPRKQLPSKLKPNRKK